MFQTGFRVKLIYFGREVIRSNWNSINKGPLTKAGNKVRMYARQSIRRRKRRRPSPAGTPPFSHVESRTPPFKMIYSLPINIGTGVIVGMVGFNPADPVPGVHEHGLAVPRRIPRWQLNRSGVTPTRGRRRYNKMGQRIHYRQAQTVTLNVKYPARPFMSPALERAWPELPPLWQNSIAKSS